MTSIPCGGRYKAGKAGISLGRLVGWDTGHSRGVSWINNPYAVVAAANTTVPRSKTPPTPVHRIHDECATVYYCTIRPGPPF